MHLDVETGCGRSRKGEGESLGQNNGFEAISVEAMTGKKLQTIWNQSMKVVKENQIKKKNVECEAFLAFRCILLEITSLKVCEQSPETDLKRDTYSMFVLWV